MPSNPNRPADPMVPANPSPAVDGRWLVCEDRFRRRPAIRRLEQRRLLHRFYELRPVPAQRGNLP